MRYSIDSIIGCKLNRPVSLSEDINCQQLLTSQTSPTLQYRGRSTRTDSLLRVLTYSCYKANVMLETFLIVPLLIQYLAMAADEFYFHQRRSLQRWERLGHPVDTLSVMAAYFSIAWTPFSTNQLILFVVLAFVSCLLITKDEWVHQVQCTPGEHWLHSVLFVMHPLVLVNAGLCWYLISTPDSDIWAHASFANVNILTLYLKTQLLAVCTVFIFQTIYWNYPWKKQLLK